MFAPVRYLVILLASGGAASRVAAQAAAPAGMAPAGFSAAGLARVDSAMQAFVDAGKLPGIVAAIAKNGRVVHWKAYGKRSVEAADPMEPNDLFRIYSMTKPITSVAAMILVEEGRIGLDDPVAKHLPVFAPVQVWTPTGLVPPKRPMTVRDLLRHTSGLSYGLFGETPVDSLYRKANLLTPARDLGQVVAEIAKLPLLGHPGELWNYGMSTDVLGRVIEVVSGQTLAEFFEQRIFRPLKMEDSFFEVPAEKRDRFTGYYARLPSGKFFLADSPDTGSYTRRPAQYLGGSGLVSSASDYLRFAQMIQNGGELDGVRILRKKTVTEMTKNQLPPALIPIGFGKNKIAGTTFGLGFSIVVDQLAPPEGPMGRAGWSGYANTFFWLDPTRQIVGLVMTQFFPFQAQPIDADFRRLLYAAQDGEKP